MLYCLCELGTAPIAKNSVHPDCRIQGGTTPMIKNIIVVDEQGNQYEATYPKRAKGLVKNGRARLIGENKICLACPPKMNLEDHEMTQNHPISEPAAVVAEETPTRALSMSYILEQIEQVAAQTAYLNAAIAELGALEIGGPGDKGKAQAIADVVRCRETTNQQLLKLYEKMYDDCKPQAQADLRRDILSFIGDLPPAEAQECLMKIYESTQGSSALASRFDEVGTWLKSQNQDEYSPAAWLALTEAAKAQLMRNW